MCINCSFQDCGTNHKFTAQFSFFSPSTTGNPLMMKALCLRGSSVRLVLLWSWWTCPNLPKSETLKQWLPPEQHWIMADLTAEQSESLCLSFPAEDYKWKRGSWSSSRTFVTKAHQKYSVNKKRNHKGFFERGHRWCIFPGWRDPPHKEPCSCEEPSQGSRNVPQRNLYLNKPKNASFLTLQKELSRTLIIKSILNCRAVSGRSWAFEFLNIPCGVRFVV